MSSENTFTSARTACPLADVLGSVKPHPVGDENQFRRYGGAMVSTSRVAGLPDVERKMVMFRVGARNAKKGLDSFLRVKNCTPVAQIYMGIKLNDSLYGSLNSSMRKYVNTNIDYADCDLAGVICRLAAAAALYTVKGELSTGDIRAGEPIKVRVITTQVKALPAPGHVFVPQQASFLDCPEALAAIIAAVNGEGALVLTDAVRMNPDTGAARIPGAGGSNLAVGCVRALRILCSMYDDSGAAAIAAFAMAKGVHSVLSVTGHTDEGGYLREVWREDQFGPCYGGVMVGALEGYHKFPDTFRHDKSGVYAIVDSIALVSAGCVALSDPLVSMGGSKYPTTVSCGSITEEGGEITAKQAGQVRNEICARAPLFSHNYAANLGTHLLGDSGMSEVAAAALQGMFQSLAVSESLSTRHVVGKVVAPFYWIEPTTLFAHRDSGVATAHGYGVLAGTMSSHERAAYPKARVLHATDSRDYIAYEHTSVRTVPGYLHMYMSPRGMMANVTPWQFRDERMLLHGRGHVDGREADKDVSVSRERHDGLDAYLWRHGQTMIPSPAEMMYIGREMGIRVNKGDFDEEDLRYDPETVVTAVDSQGAVKVSLLAIRPSALGVGTGHGELPAVHRLRNQAARMLTAVGSSTARRISPAPHVIPCGDLEPGEFRLEEDEDVAPAPPEVEAGDVGATAPADELGPSTARVFMDAPMRLPGRPAPTLDDGPAGEEVAPPSGVGSSAIPVAADEGVEEYEEAPQAPLPGEEGAEGQ